MHSFFSKNPTPTEIYTLSLHDALPIFELHRRPGLEALHAIGLVLHDLAATRNQRDDAGQLLLVDKVLRSEEHTSELQSQSNIVCRLLLEKKKTMKTCNGDIHIICQFVT